HVALADARRRDLDELGALAHFIDRGATAIAHGGTQAAGHLEDDRDHRALVGHPAFDALGHQLVGVRVGGLVVFLEVAIGRAGLHRADRAHAAVALVAAALVEDHFA